MAVGRHRRGLCRPELLLYSRGQERQQAISLELADTLDQMTIAVEAGLGFEAAMSRAGRNGRGPLAEELVRTLQDIAVGQPRRRPTWRWPSGRRCPTCAASSGGRAGRRVRRLDRRRAAHPGAEMRLKRRQRAEEKAMQIPVKVIFPLILCILPTLFIVLLGPPSWTSPRPSAGDEPAPVRESCEPVAIRR
jgi:tight adherence protein C